jgi:hypothetical protein
LGYGPPDQCTQWVGGCILSRKRLMALDAGRFFGRKGRVLPESHTGGAVLWPKGQGLPHLSRAAGSAHADPARLLLEEARFWEAPVRPDNSVVAYFGAKR